jgi:hypothetical protein
LTVTGTIAGKAEAASKSGTGSVKGGLTILSGAKPMPATSVFDAYVRMATVIPYPSSGSGTSGTLSYPLLSAAVNPAGAANAKGIYYISVPSTKALTIQTSRIRGTLLIDCADRATVILTSMICWDPELPELPILMIRHTGTGTANDTISPPAGTITEVLDNLNPPSTPYNGNSNILPLVTDSYPSQLNGLIHVISPGGATGVSQVNIGGGASIKGMVIVDGNVTATDAIVQHDDNLYANPPIGYTTGPVMIPIPGTWRWEVLP